MNGINLSPSSITGATTTSALDIASSTVSSVVSAVTSSIEIYNKHMAMDMGSGTAMDMGSSSTAAGAAAASATATSSAMSGMHMGGMDMGGGSCEMSMSWNWKVIDSCFLAEGWHVKTKGQFAGTCIGVFCWVVFLIWLRKARSALDSHIVQNKVRRLAKGGNLNVAQNSLQADEQPQSGAISDDKDHGLVASSASGGHNSPNRSNTFLGRCGDTIMGRSPVDNVGEAGALPFSSNQGTASRSSVRPNLLEQIVRALMFGFEYSIVWLLGLILMSYNGYVIISAFLGAFIGFLLFDWNALPLQISAPAAPRCC